MEAAHGSGSHVAFKVLLWAVIGITGVCIVVVLLLNYFPPPRDNDLTETFTSVIKLSIGAIVGAFGGRSVT